MKSIFIFTALLLLIVSGSSVNKPQSLQGNIERCIADIAKATETLVNAVKAAVAQDWVAFAKGLIALAQDIKPMVEDCKDPICLGPATQRCQQKEQRTCEQWGAIMYPECNQGYSNFGCCICAEQCPNSFDDEGLYCKKPSSYGRGAGYPWEFGDGPNLDKAMQRCLAQNPQGCEQYGEIIYPKCAQNFHAVGCCICSPDCPSSYTDIGVSCKKPNYDRGLGYPIYWSDCPNSSFNLEMKLRQEMRFLQTKFADLTCDQLTAALQANAQIFINGNYTQDINSSVEVTPTISQQSAQYLELCADLDKIDN